MNRRDYDEYAEVAEAAEPDVDPRVKAMQRVVDLEREHQWAQRDADERQKKAAHIGEQLSEARDDLNGLLGLPSHSSQKSVGIMLNGSVR